MDRAATSEPELELARTILNRNTSRARNLKLWAFMPSESGTANSERWPSLCQAKHQQHEAEQQRQMQTGMGVSFACPPSLLLPDCKSAVPGYTVSLGLHGDELLCMTNGCARDTGVLSMRLSRANNELPHKQSVSCLRVKHHKALGSKSRIFPAALQLLPKKPNSWPPPG